MSSKKSLTILSVVFLSFFISASAVFAIGDDRYSRPSLKDLKKLCVVVQIEKGLSEDFKKVGLSEERIRTNIELKLREAKIDIAYSMGFSPGYPDSPRGGGWFE